MCFVYQVSPCANFKQPSGNPTHLLRSLWPFVGIFEGPDGDPSEEVQELSGIAQVFGASLSFYAQVLVAHDCGYPLSRYTCRATRVAADFLDFTAFCRCSTGVAPHPRKILVSHLSSPPFPGGVAPKFGSEKASRYTGVSQVQLRVSRYTVQLSAQSRPFSAACTQFSVDASLGAIRGQLSGVPCTRQAF